MDPWDPDFEATFRSIFPRAVGVAYRILGTAVEAEDAAAEALARALAEWRRVSTLNYRDNWILRVTTNVALDAARRRQRGAAVQQTEPAQARDCSEPDVNRVLVSGAMARLPRRQREVLALRYFGDLPEDEVASVLGISVGSVKTHAHRAIESMRRAIGEPAQEVADVAS